MKVSNSEDLASYAVPESCVAYREVRGEALTGVRKGQPLSRERIKFQGADAVKPAEGNTKRSDIASFALALRGLRTWHFRKLLAWEPGDLLSDHRLQHQPKARIGKARNRIR